MSSMLQKAYEYHITVHKVSGREPRGQEMNKERRSLNGKQETLNHKLSITEMDMSEYFSIL